ncbi:MAG: S8 family serine peptidase [Caldicoprobacteraceae bacterium]|jgi:hypothetical protein
MRTAIIDNGIDIGTFSLYANQPVCLKVCDGKIIPAEPPQRITHGGLCGRIFAQQSGALPDVSICLSRDDEHRSNVNDLSTALEWCSYNDIDLVNLSMGTTRFSDCAILYETLKKLQSAGVVLVTAASNDGLITYPASLDLCIGVCQTYLPGLDAGCYAYLENPFDGIDVVTYPVIYSELNLMGSNSLSAAFIAGMIRKQFSSSIDTRTVRRWLLDNAQGIAAEWERDYYREKMNFMPDHESIIIACCAISSEQSEIFMEALKKRIICDGYSCAILAKRGTSSLSTHKFSLEHSPMSLSESLSYVTRSCRPSVILLDEWELAYSADVLVHEDVVHNKLHSNALLSCSLSDTNPDALWKRTKELFEKNDD